MFKKKTFPIISVIVAVSLVIIVVAILATAGMFTLLQNRIALSNNNAHNVQENAIGSYLEMGKMLAGFGGERTYLILLQNDHELRATGGFIGQYAIMEVQNGSVKEFFTQDSGVLDTQAPVGVQVPRSPQALSTYLNQNFMFFRDSNWNPQFDEAAQHIVQTYALERGMYAEKIDGVIAIDTYVLQALFNRLGTIEIDGVAFTPDNIIDTLEYEVEVAYKERGIEKIDRKDVIEKIGKALLKRAQETSPLEIPGIIKELTTLADEKHILAFDYDTAIQTWYEQKGWDGSYKYADNHVIQIIDSNLNAFKTDRVIQRAIQHTIKPAEQGSYQADLTLTYTNTAQEKDYRTREYRTYTRVRLPASATNITVTPGTYNQHGDPGFDVISTDQYTQVGIFFTVDIASQRALTLSYSIPSIEKELNVDFVKQPGTNAPQLTLNYSFDTTIADHSQNLGCSLFSCEWKGDMRTDHAVSVQLK